MRIAYVVAYGLGMIWGAGVLIVSALNPELHGAGFWPAMAVLAVAAAPCAILWGLRRYFTGGWFG